MALGFWAVGYNPVLWGGVTPAVTVTFGHGARHLVATTVSRLAVEDAIRIRIVALGAGAGAHWGWLQVGGQWVQYRALYLQNGIVNIGTYFPVSNPLTNK